MLEKVINKYRNYIVDIVIIISLGLIFISLLFFKFFLNPFHYFAADVSEMYFPWFVFINSSVRSLKFPVLNQFWFYGSLPFAAIESGVFYLPNLIVHFFFDAAKNLDLAYFIFVAIQIAYYLLAAISMYLLLIKGLKLHRAAAIFSSIVYAFSGTFIGRNTHPLYLIQLAWLPMLFFTYFLFMENKKFIYFFLASIILSFIINAGAPQLTYYIVLFFILGIIFFSITERKSLRLKLFIASLGIVFISFLVSAPKILLSLELSQNITRVSTDATLSRLYDSLSPAYYLTLIIPNLFGRHQVGYWGSDIPYGNWEHYLYIGLIPLFFLIYAFKWQNRRILAFFTASLMLSVLFSLGKYNIFSIPLNKYLPFSDTFIIVSRISDLFHFFLVVLTAIGFHVFLTIPKRLFKSILPILPILGIGILLMLLPFDYFPGIQTALKHSKTDGINLAIQSIFIFKKILILNVFLIFFYLLFNVRKRVFLFAVLAVYAFDLFVTCANFNPIEGSPGTPNHYFGSNTSLDFIKNDETIFRVQNISPRNNNMIQKIESTYGYHTLETKAYHKIVNLVNLNNRKIVNLLNIKYYISDEDLEPKGNFIKVNRNLWKNQTNLPRLWFVPSFKLADNEEKMKALVLSANFDPANEVVLYKDDVNKFNQNEYKSTLNETETKAEIHILNYQGDNLKANVQADSPGFIVFSQMQYPGWIASVDGKKTALLPADLSIYAIPISKGIHDIEFEFRSKPIYYGNLISFSTLSLIILTVMRFKYNEPKRKKLTF